jgi:hypothetical protein
MSILKIEPQTANNTANFAFGNVFAANYYYANGAIFSGGGGGSGTVKYTATTTPPTSNNSPGDQWFNTTSQILYEYINDGTGNYWVDIISPTIGQSSSLPAVITSGTSNVTITPSGNINLSISGISNVLTTTTTGITTSGTITSANGVYTQSAYTGAYSNGVVIDYASSNGRFSVGNTAGMNFYNNGVANTVIFSVNPVGNANVVGSLTVSNGATIIGNLSTGNIAITGNMTLAGALTLQQTYEVVTPITGATGTVTHDFSVAGTYYHDSPAASWLVNITNIPTINNRVFVVALVIKQGATGYLPTSYQVNTNTIAVKWIQGAAPVPSTVGKFDIVSLSCLYTGSGWTIFGQAASYS